MSHQPTPGGGPNQTLIELILALKGLAQTFDLAHANLRSLIESEAKASSKEIDRLRDLIAKNSQTLTVLPITISDRVEKLVDKLEEEIDEKVEAMLREVTVAVHQVHEKFILYLETKGEAVPQEILESKTNITGRVEVRRDGTVGIEFQAEWAKKMFSGLKYLAIGGSGVGVFEAIRYVFGL
jgi:hypothetical protein